MEKIEFEKLKNKEDMIIAFNQLKDDYSKLFQEYYFSKPKLVFQKNADKTTNKMIIPKTIIEQWGNQFYMEIYQDKIVLKPIKKGE